MIKSSANIVLKKINKVSLITILILAVSFSFGIPLTGKSMIHTANKYMESSDALQYEFTHSLGVDQQMIDQITKITGIKGFGVVDADSYVNLDGSESVVRVFTYSTTTHKDLTLIDGNYPSNNGEAVIDQRLKDYHGVEIGDVIEIKENSVYLSHSAKVVGIVSSNLYMNLERGFSNLGMGRVEGFVYSLGIETKADAFTSVRFYDVFSDSIIDALQKSQKTITTERFNRIASPLLADLQIREFKLDEAITLSNAKFDIRKREFDSIQLSLQDTHSEIESALSEMGNDLGIIFGPQSLQTKLDTLIRLIDDKEVNEIPGLETAILELQSTHNMLKTQIDELKLQLESVQEPNLVLEIQSKIETLKNQLDNVLLDKENLELELMSLNENINLYRSEFIRISNGIETYTTNYGIYQQGFSNYLKERDAANASFEKESSALILQRQKIEAMEKGEGTLKNREEVVVGFIELIEDSYRIVEVGRFIPVLLFLVVLIISLSVIYTETKNLHNYFFKVWISSTTIGYLVGYLLVSKILFKLYQSMYQTPSLSYSFDLWIFIKPLFLAYFTTLFLFYAIQLVRNLKQNRRPVKREKVLKFKNPSTLKLNKLTKLRFRNIIRSKLLVIVICLVTSLLLALLSASITYKIELSRLIETQYSQVLKYDGLINVSKDFDQDLEGFKETVRISDNKTLINDYATSIYVFSSSESIKNWVQLNDVSSNKTLELIDGFVVITQKLATAHNISIGSTVEIKTESRAADFVVSGISENQLGHAIYMSELTYVNSGLESIGKNGVLFKYSGESSNIIENTLKLDGVKSISFKEELVTSYKEMIESYNLLILIPILLSILCLISSAVSIILIVMSKREKDLYILLNYGYSEKTLLRERFLDSLVFNVMSLILSFIFSTVLYRYLVITTQVPDLIISIEPNIYILVSMCIGGFIVISLLMWWLNSNLSIEEKK